MKYSEYICYKNKYKLNFNINKFQRIIEEEERFKYKEKKVFICVIRIHWL